MPADYANLPAHIATRVAVAAWNEEEARVRLEKVPANVGDQRIAALVALDAARAEKVEALREAREAERVTVEKVATAIALAYLPTGGKVTDLYPEAKAALRAAGYTVGE